jgi:hypothetical protein
MIKKLFESHIKNIPMCYLLEMMCLFAEDGRENLKFI